VTAVAAPTLTLLCGLPASGKSRYAAAASALTGQRVLTADACREQRASYAALFPALYSAARADLRAGRSVIIDACSLTRRARTEARLLAQSAGARIELVVFLTPWRVCAERDAARARPAGVNARSALAMQAAYADIARERYDTVKYAR